MLAPSIYSRVASSMPDLFPPLGSIICKPVPTDHERRIAAILSEADLSPPRRIPVLVEPDFCDFEAFLQSNIDEARSLLVQQRTSDPGYRQPDQQKRHAFRSKTSKEAILNTVNWVFTKHEVAKAFDELLSRSPLPVPGIAQALLSHASLASAEELWRHFHDPKLEKRMGTRSKKINPPWLHSSLSSVVLKRSSSLALKTRSSVALETISLVIPEITWLEKVCSQENLDYIRLMCQAGFSPVALDRAFKVALSKYSMGAMEILLSFGAIASVACQEPIRERVKLHDVSLVRLLLSAPSSMSIEVWQSCLELELQSKEASWAQTLDLLLLCLAHRPDIACRPLLLQALKSQNLPAATIVLAYGRFSRDYFADFRKFACELATRVPDDERRHKFFRALAKSEFVADNLTLRQELMKDVKARQLPLVKLLVDAGVVVDMEPYNAFYWAVSHMDLDILELFKNCKFSSSISLALKLVPDSTSELDWLRLVEILGPRVLAGGPLDSCLIRAVRSQHNRLVGAMIRYGASIELEQASAVRIALLNSNLELLSILLRRECSAITLSAAIPTAMLLKSRSIRFQAMKALIERGVLPLSLGLPLQKLVSEDGDIDSELIQLLLQHKAPVDGPGDDTNNVILVAARRGNLSILKMLCDAGPRNETLSQAVPVAFGVMDTCGGDVAVDMIKLLLQKGAAGTLVHQTLLAAAEKGRLESVRLLVEHGASANYLNGASFGFALTTSNFKLLQILCSKCPPNKASIVSRLSLAIDPRYFALEALELLLSSARRDSPGLGAWWQSGRLRGNPNITAIVPCLLRHGLDVNLRNGVVLSFAIRENNLVLLARVLSVNPSIASLKTAFRTATGVRPRSLELDVMRLLLEKAESAEIGQSEALLQETHSALSGDFAGLRLLLRHNAVASPFVFTSECLNTASSKISRMEKQEIFESLLAPRAGILTNDMSNLLAHSVTGLPECTQLPQLLLEYGAEVKFETLKVALETSCFDLLYVLLRGIKSVDTRRTAFTHARKTTMASDRRYWIYQHLLDKGIPSNDVSEALLDSLKVDDLGDLAFPKLFLENGASPGYRNGEPFSLALRAKPPESLFAVRLLTQYLVDDSMATAAFNVLVKASLAKNQLRTEINPLLREWNISKSSISKFLADSFKNGFPDISEVELLIAKGADPNTDNGNLFVMAAKRGAIAVFQALSKSANLRVVLKALLDNFQAESEVVGWSRLCLDEQPRSGKIDQNELLFQCMKKFPTGTALLKFLFDRGASASAKIYYSLCPGWKPEPCTALIWALFQKPRVETDVILILLSQGHTGALQLNHIAFPYN